MDSNIIITSSPYYPQGNGEAERAVQIIKHLLRKTDDPYMALLAYRDTPLEIGYSPSELLMGRRLRTTVPTTREQLKPKTPYASVIQIRDRHIKERQKRNFDSYHGARLLPELQPRDNLWLKDRNTTGEVIKEVSRRLYVVKTPEGAFRRKRRQMVSLPDQERPEPGSNLDEESEIEDTDALEEPQATANVSPQSRAY
jgi:hypothetical protein